MSVAALSRLSHNQICKSLKKWLDLQRVRGTWFHYASTHSSPQYGKKLKDLGVKAGIFDYGFVHDSDYSAWIEVKRKGDYLRKDQKAFKAWLDERAIRNAVITTDDPAVLIGETQRLLRLWGFL